MKRDGKRLALLNARKKKDLKWGKLDSKYKKNLHRLEKKVPRGLPKGGSEKTPSQGA